MIVLGIETATRFGSVGLVEQTGLATRILAESVQEAGRTHGAMLLAQIDAALVSARLELSAVEAFAVSTGPGSFTGLRVGMATAKALAWAAGAPIAGVGTLAAWASSWASASGEALLGKTICVALDARKGEVYRAAFVVAGPGGELRRLLPDAVEKPAACARSFENLGSDPREIHMLGDGVFRYAEPFAGIGEDRRCALEEHPPSGVHVALLALPRLAAGQGDDVRDLAPVYVRASEAELSLLPAGRENS
ncbi:MAG: tRNA (adenosine(37)-N6)-threonylcarbamoyltransferase complex dimerization subunit type 1 TsaB [Deltaproteobacteria bacterium]